MRVLSRPSSFETVISAIYRTALDRSLWPEAIVAVSDYIGASGGMLAFHDLRPAAVSRNWMVIGRLRADLTDMYLKQYADNPYSRVIRHHPAGSILSLNSIADPAPIARTAFHTDVFVPQRIADMLVLPYAAWQRGSTTGGASFTLDPRGAADVGRRQRRLAQIAPHLLRALDLGVAAEASDAARASLFALIDTAAVPAMLLNAVGELAYANPAAEALLREGDGLRAGGRTAAETKRLQASRPAETQRLAATIGRAVSAAMDPEGASEAGQALSVRIGRPSGRPDLAVCLIPLPVQGNPWSGPASIHAALFVLQPGRAWSEADGRIAAELGAIYGLTPAEQRVAGLVGAGLGLPETARVLCISVETARTHLRRCLAKTGVRSQVDLARLLAPFPAARM